MKLAQRLVGVFMVGFLATSQAHAQDESQPNRVMFTNVNVFDGVSESLEMNTNVLVEDNLVAAVGPSITLPEGAEVIDGGGRTLMPGLIDSHVHFNLSMDGGRQGMESSRWDYLAVMGAAAAQDWLADGFTTARDMGGTHDGLRRVIDSGLMDGPRLYLATGMISQSSGHADMLLDSQTDPAQSNLGKLEITHIADGEDEMRKAVRRNFSLGANIIKIMIGGGVAGAKGPYVCGPVYR